MSRLAFWRTKSLRVRKRGFAPTSQSQNQLARIVALILAPDRARQFKRGLLSKAFIRGGYPHARPCRGAEDRFGKVMCRDSFHDDENKPRPERERKGRIWE